MQANIPDKSRVVFTGSIPPDHYEWKGTPDVRVRWRLALLREPSPKGVFTLKLPEKVGSHGSD